jgi:hypothetical protein
VRGTCVAHLILLDHLNKAEWLYVYYSDDEFEKNEIGRACSTYVGEERWVQGFGEKT